MSILYTLFSTLVLICAAVVTLSYAIAWYEYANRDPQLLQKRFAAPTLLRTLWLLIQESLLLALTVLLYPFGWLPVKGPQGSRGHKGQRPIILLHGLFHNRACWSFVYLILRLRGFRNIYTLNLPPWKDVETLTEELAKLVDRLRQNLEIERVDLVGHSMGGIIARNYLQIRGGAQKVHTLVQLGSPNGGSKLVPFVLSPLGKLLMPGSEFLLRLVAAPQPPGGQVVSIYSRQDNMVIPYESARLAWAENVELENMGHTTLLYHPRVLGTLIAQLRKEEE